MRSPCFAAVALASSPTAATSATTPAMTSGSRARTSNRTLARRVPTASAPAQPAAMPTATGVTLCRTTSANTCATGAPRATRMFISRRRRDTPYAVVAYTPIVAMTSATVPNATNSHI